PGSRPRRARCTWKPRAAGPPSPPRRCTPSAPPQATWTASDSSLSCGWACYRDPAMATFEGVITALVTPFRDDAVDEAALRRLVAEPIAAGVDGLVPVGTTGESPTLTFEEHIRVIKVVIEAAKKRVPVIAGTGSNSTREAIDLSQAAREAGADGLLVVT